jgi:hypothetical protein
MGNEAVANGRQYGSYDSGMCQKYVRGPCWEVGSLYGSAIEAWNGAKLKHPGDRTPPKGAPVYYRGGQYGHAVIYVGNDDIRSTDCASTGLVSDADLSWPERAWGYAYLGWTGDINGVTLPLGGTDTGGTPPPESEDAMPKHVAASTPGIELTGDWQVVTWQNTSGDDNGVAEAGNPGFTFSGPYMATVAARMTGKPPAGSTVQTRPVEGNFEDGDWQVTQTHPAAETVASGSDTYHADSRAQNLNKGDRLRIQIRGPEGCRAESIGVHILFWD